MTEIDTGEGKLCLATVIDLFSRRRLGYAMGTRHDAELGVFQSMGRVVPASTTPSARRSTAS
jgi:transposase InsO family protein